MSMVATLTRKHFPFPTFNPGQEEAIIQTVEAFLAGKNHVILEAPTGVGKSAIATTVHRVIKDIKKGWRTTITTSTKGLQDQYVIDDGEIYDLKGKTNYNCPHDKGPYNSAECRAFCAKGKCDKDASCDYLIQRNNWCNHAPLRITNTAFQIEACQMLVMEPENRANLIVLDECHNLPRELVEHNCLGVDLENLTYVKMCWPQIIPQLFSFIAMLQGYRIGVAFIPENRLCQESLRLHNSMEAACAAMDARILSIMSGSDDAGQPTNISGAIEELQQMADKLKAFAAATGEWILTEFVLGQKLQLKPVYASAVSWGGIFRKADKFLHMSATICGSTEYARSVGIEPHDYVVINVANPIPAENRRITILPMEKVSGNYNIKKLVEGIDAIADEHDGQNGVIHSVSFKLAEEIREASRHKRKVLISNKRHEILEFLQRKRGGILISPSVETGYDFKGDLCRWQILAKVPFGNLGDPFVEFNMKRSPKWYAREAILRTVQASGRAVRGVDDYAATYIIDSNFQRLLNGNRELFPGWWLDAIEEF